MPIGIPSLSKGIGPIPGPGRGLTKGISGGATITKGISGAGIIKSGPRSTRGVINIPAGPGNLGLPGTHGGTVISRPPPTGAAAPGGTSQTAAPTGNDALDSTYYQNLSDNALKVGQQINALNLKGAEDSTALQSSLAQLAYQQPRAQLGLEQRASAGGGLYSSVYNQNLGNMNYQFAGKQGAAQSNYTNQMSALASQIAALQTGQKIYADEQAQAAALRASNLASKDPSLGQGTGGLNTSGQPPRGPGAGPGGSTAPQRPGTLLTDTTRTTVPSAAEQLAQAIAGRQIRNIPAGPGNLGKGTPRGVRNVQPILGKGNPRRR